jgi:ribosomal protein L11 methyltransferase
MMYKKIRFDNVSSVENEILIARLSLAGYEFEEQENALIAYIDEKEFQKETLDNLSEKLNIPYSLAELPDKNWNEVWESNFTPVVVENFCAVRADFHQPIKSIAYEIIITPKMSFGTGHHATTFMMMQQMERISFNGKHVLDFGTGTGVLAILALKCGARNVVAVDNDDWSISNAKENFERNGCSGTELIKADNANVNGHYDVILANITRNVILDNLSHFVAHLTKGGVLLLSGLLSDDEMDISTKAFEYDLTLDTKTEKNNWICLRFHNH